MKNKIKINKRNSAIRISYGQAVRELLQTAKFRRDNKSLFFIRLFSDRKELLELYNALNGSDYTDPDMISVTTIDDYLYIGYKNDCSFIIGSVLNLYEHQSTLNPNMPIRGLEYFADIYRAYIASNGFNVYGTKLIKLPTPIYIVFYNGDTETEDRFEYRLSDAFEGEGCLECVATVININQGHNEKLLGDCRTLMGYSKFVAEVKEYMAMGYSREKAIDMAVDYCIEHDILRDYLLKHRSEVRHMFPADYSFREYVKVIKKDYERMLEEKDAELEEKDAEYRTELEEKDAKYRNELAEKDAEINRLKKELETMIK